MADSVRDKVPVSLKLDKDIRDLTVQVARAKGVDLSEHIRGLIIEDLDRRRLLDARVSSLVVHR